LHARDAFRGELGDYGGRRLRIAEKRIDEGTAAKLTSSDRYRRDAAYVPRNRDACGFDWRPLPAQATNALRHATVVNFASAIDPR
jgi:hypothetical protein